MPHVSVNVVMQ